MPVAVYGATGRTGRLVLSELARRGLECVIGGRDAGGLAELAERGGVADVRSARIEDPGSLNGVLSGCDVVVNCAGSIAGEPMVRAAIETGTHYVDPAGEQPFIRKLFDRYGEIASRAEVALVPALGFDYAPGDCIARLAARRHEPLRELVIAYALSGSATSRDAVSAPSGATDGGEVIYREGGWAPAPSGVQRASFRFPPPLGRQPMQRYGSGEVITVPRHTRTRRVTSLITASTWSPHPSLTPLLPFVRPLAARVRRSPLRAVLELAAPGRGPDGSDWGDRRTAGYTIAAVAHGEDGSVGRGLVQGSDFYGLTATALAIGAVGLSVAPGVTGAASPAVAFDPAELLDSLADRGLRWRLE